MSTPDRAPKGQTAALRATAMALATLIALPAVAQQDLRQNDWAFNLFNDSSMPVQAFQTEDMSGFLSLNWLNRIVNPGEGLTMEFNDPNDTRCEVLTRVTFQNGAVLDGYIDYCGTGMVQVTNDGLFFE